MSLSNLVADANRHFRDLRILDNILLEVGFPILYERNSVSVSALVIKVRSSLDLKERTYALEELRKQVKSALPNGATLRELQSQAAFYGVGNYSRMSKEDLTRAIESITSNRRCSPLPFEGGTEAIKDSLLKP